MSAALTTAGDHAPDHASEHAWPQAPGHALPPGITVAGGAGGTRAHLADLGAAAAVLDLAAAQLEVAAELLGTVARLVDSASRWSPSTAAAARAELAPLLGPWSGARARAVQVRSRAASLRSVADLYAATDDAVAAMVRPRLVSFGAVVGDLGPAGWVLQGGVLVGGAAIAAAGVVGLRLVRRTVTPAGLALRALSTPDALQASGHRGFVARTVGGPGVLPQGLGWPAARTLEAAVPGLAGLVLGVAPGRATPGGRPVAQAARVLAGAGALGSRVTGRAVGALVVAPLVRPDAARRAPTVPPRTSADVLRQVRSLYPAAGGTPGTVNVQELGHPDGSRSWVVNVPGTQDWSPLAAANPMDATTNLQISGGLPQDATRLVTEAMTQAGVAPGEPVLLAGHSQGGIVAMQVAADPALAQRFSVEAVLTAGSPVGAMPLPDHVEALHLEAVQDYVPALDGAPNPDTPRRTTVTTDLWQVQDRPLDVDAAASPATAHDLEAYTRTAEALQGSDHPSLRAFDTAAGRVLGPAGTTVRDHRYLGVRVPGE